MHIEENSAPHVNGEVTISRIRSELYNLLGLIVLIDIFELAVYPVKVILFHSHHARYVSLGLYCQSCAGIDLQSSRYDTEGFEYDRRWMIVDVEKQKQLSARDDRGIKVCHICQCNICLRSVISIS